MIDIILYDKVNSGSLGLVFMMKKAVVVTGRAANVWGSPGDCVGHVSWVF